MKKHINYGIIFDPRKDLKPIVYGDASYAIHEDATSRTGVVVMMCGGVIATISTKQKLVTKSSTEAELVALCEATTWALVMKNFLQQQNIFVNKIHTHEIG